MLLGVTGKVQGEGFRGRMCTVENLTLTLADTEYVFTFPPKTLSWEIKGRNSETFRFSYRVGTSLTVFKTVPTGASVYEQNVYFEQYPYIYLSAPGVGVVLEIDYCQ